MGKRVGTLLEWWVLSIKPIASHLLPLSQVKDNQWKSYTQREPTRGLPRQWQAGDQLHCPALQTGDDHNGVIPVFAHQSHGFGIVQSLIPLELSPLARWVQFLVWVQFLSSWPLLSSIPHPLESQCLFFGITQFLISFKINPLAPFKINPSVLRFLNPLAPSPSITWFWDCSSLLSLRGQHHHTTSSQPVPTQPGKSFLKPRWLL